MVSGSTASLSNETPAAISDDKQEAGLHGGNTGSYAAHQKRLISLFLGFLSLPSGLVKSDTQAWTDAPLSDGAHARNRGHPPERLERVKNRLAGLYRKHLRVRTKRFHRNELIESTV